jgi:hypothetical protein
MATSMDQFVRELRAFNNKKAVLKELRLGIRRPFPAVRKKIKKSAIDTLPKRGGLNKWAASTRVTLRIRASGRAAGVTVVGGRNSSGGRSDVNALDRGRVRAPSWGRRGPGSWHSQAVPPGFFTNPVTEATEWHEEIDRAVDTAFDQIRRG